MATYRGEQEARYHDDSPADAAVRSTVEDDDTLNYPMSACVVVVAIEDTSITRYSAWLADAYETQTVRLGQTVSPCLETDVLVVDQRMLMMAKKSASEKIVRKCGDCWVLAPAHLKTCDDLIDAYIAEPVSRDRLLERVKAATQLVSYNASVSELLSLTMRRQRLQDRADTGHVENGSNVAFLSKRINELHQYIEDELVDIESQYTESLGRKDQSLTRQKVEDETG